MSKVQKICMAVAIVIVMAIPVVLNWNNARVKTRERNRIVSHNVGRITKALSLYFQENNKYPQDLDALVKHYGVRQEQTLNLGYSPSRNLGSYGACYRQETALIFGKKVTWISIGSPISEESHEELARRLELELRCYYSKHGRYPDTLLESVNPKATEYIAAIEEKDFDYSVSEDRQSCSLDDKEIGE